MARPVNGRGSAGFTGSPSANAATAAGSRDTNAACSSSSGNASEAAAERASAATSPTPASAEESAAALRGLGFGSPACRFVSEFGTARSSAGEGIEEPSGEELLCCQQPGSGLRRRLISPLEIHFSQGHVRPDFQDGRIVEDSASAIESEYLSFPTFPEIEVIRWRCKLRKEDGATKTDESGMELYGDREWYSLDNRRLYCLQRAAARLYPAEVRCAVIVIRQEDGNCREFRKFRTPDLGRTVGIGHRDAGEAMPRWSWRKEVGLPDLPPPVGQAIASRHARKRGPNARGPHSGDRRGGRFHGSRSDEEDSGSKWDPVLHVAFFVLIYAGLRIVLRVVMVVQPWAWFSTGDAGGELAAAVAGSVGAGLPAEGVGMES
eukprot:TRINITY_DN5192_c0_g1_i2.p1 TRINITY_DN5192_c0_g1~~TRINITY_DN5192_c0_g1_i2.p1  ORF type:complete len:377 (+),score=65.28 TRINITY_DN5192_c0_g1_i2:31-1161(+)